MDKLVDEKQPLLKNSDQRKITINNADKQWLPCTRHYYIEDIEDKDDKSTHQVFTLKLPKLRRHDAWKTRSKYKLDLTNIPEHEDTYEDLKIKLLLTDKLVSTSRCSKDTSPKKFHSIWNEMRTYMTKWKKYDIEYYKFLNWYIKIAYSNDYFQLVELRHILLKYPIEEVCYYRLLNLC